MSQRLAHGELLALLAVLGVLVAIVVPDLGSQPWPFAPEQVNPSGLLGPLVRAADRGWELGLPRSAGLLAGLLVAVGAAAAFRFRSWPGWAAVTLTAIVVCLLSLPATFLAVGLRDATDPWQYTNDSTYQIELAGDLVLDGKTPYGRDYGDSGLERFYPAAAFEGDPQRQVALTHFAYFPGTPLTAAAWKLLPAPFDDYRVFVLIATLAAAGILLLLPAPLPWRLAGGALVAANPLALRAEWFGTADMPSIALVLLAFALALRSQPAAAAAALGVAVLLKQFALAGLPFLVALLVLQNVRGRSLRLAAGAFAAVVAAGFAPFLVADAGAVWDDTIAYGTETYRIIGYGLAGLLVEAGFVSRYGDYPFALLGALVWAPLTAWLAWVVLRTRAAWSAASGLAVSVFVLFWLSRVLQNSYLVWPLCAVVLAALLAVGERRMGTRP